MSDTPGLRQAFKRWYCRTSRKYKEHMEYRERSWVEQMYQDFLEGDCVVTFEDRRAGNGQVTLFILPIPPHLIAMRDMSLI